MIARFKNALTPRDLSWRVVTRKNVLAGVMFMSVAIAGLIISRDYPIGTAVRMSTGYMPRLLLWLLLGLGAVIGMMGLAEGDEKRPRYTLDVLRPLIAIPLALVVFGLSIERLGLIVSIALLVGIASFATRELRIVEVLLAALVLIALCWTIFILGLGLTIPVWPVL